jgi:PhoH-like ATPase
MNTSAEKIYVLDTNVLLHDPLSFTRFHEHDVVIPMVVFEELDHIKSSERDVARDARVSIGSIEKLIQNINTLVLVRDGVSLSNFNIGGKASGNLFVNSNKEYTEGCSVDNLIIDTCLELKSAHPEAEVHLVSKDINMRLKSKGKGLDFAEDYRNDQVIDDIKYISPGYENVDGDFWASIENVYTIDVGSGKLRSTYHVLPRPSNLECHLNMYISDENGFVGRIVDIGSDVLFFGGIEHEVSTDSIVIKDISKKTIEVWNVEPKNVEQKYAMEAMLSPEISLVSLIGVAGTGKTLLALAAAMALCEDPTSPVRRIIVTRSTPPIAEDIGLLPGTEEEKCLPWLMAFKDSLEFLVGGQSCGDESNAAINAQNESTLNYVVEKFSIEFRSINFMRGRTLNDTVIILDETQNNTPSQVKTIVTRVGLGSKIFLTGNLGQIDSKMITPLNSGLTHAVETFKDFNGAATIMLKGGQRSPLATYAEENM